MISCWFVQHLNPNTLTSCKMPSSVLWDGRLLPRRMWFFIVARALGVEIDLAECRLNLVAVCNTEEAEKRA